MALPKFWHMYRLTRPAELTYSQGGMEICRVGLVCSEKYQDKETQLWIDATAFKKTAVALSSVQKGHRVHVLGQISTESWQDKETGQKRSKTVMIVDRFDYIEKKEGGQQGNQGFQGHQQNTGSNQQQGFQQSNQQPQNNFQQQGQQGPPDDDIPF